MTMLTKTIAIIGLCSLGACSGPLSLVVGGDYPPALTSALPVSVTLVMSDEFRNYVATSDGQVSLEVGAAQAAMFEAVMTPRFKELLVVSERPDVIATDWLIEPSVSSMQVGVPAVTHLEVYEVWLKYRLNISDQNGNDIVSWFIPAYGKAPSSFTKSRSAAIRAASEIALRDMGARVITDLHRVPELHSSLAEEGF